MWGRNLLCANARGIPRGESRQELRETLNVSFNFLWYFPSGSAINYCLNMDIFRQMLQGVHYVHKTGLMHRDLKVIPLPNCIYVTLRITVSNLQEKFNLTIGWISTLPSYNPHFYRQQTADLLIPILLSFEMLSEQSHKGENTTLKTTPCKAIRSC